MPLSCGSSQDVLPLPRSSLCPCRKRQTLRTRRGLREVSSRAPWDSRAGACLDVECRACSRLGACASPVFLRDPPAHSTGSLCARCRVFPQALRGALPGSRAVIPAPSDAFRVPPLLYSSPSSPWEMPLLPRAASALSRAELPMAQVRVCGAPSCVSRSLSGLGHRAGTCPGG